MPSKKIVTQYARMWPREVFDAMEENKLLVGTMKVFDRAGVYILYRDDVPYYVGRATRSLYSRLHDHANRSTDRYFNFWNYFSVFVVAAEHVDEVEGVLIAAMTTANSAVPRIPQIKLDPKLARILRQARRHQFDHQSA